MPLAVRADQLCVPRNLTRVVGGAAPVVGVTGDVRQQGVRAVSESALRTYLFKICQAVESVR